MPTLSIVIPVLDDRRVIETATLIVEYFSTTQVSYEVIVCGLLLYPYALPNGVRFVRGKGPKGSNILGGLRAARGRQILLLDADLPTHLTALDTLLAAHPKCDLVFCQRVPTQRGPLAWSRALRTVSFRRCISLLFPVLRDWDTQFGVKRLSLGFANRLLARKTCVSGLGYDIEMALYAKRAGVDVGTLALPYVERGGSVLGTFESVVHLACDIIVLLGELARSEMPGPSRP